MQTAVRMEDNDMNYHAAALIKKGLPMVDSFYVSREHLLETIYAIVENATEAELRQIRKVMERMRY